MAIDLHHKLHWSQRIALVRHNLHAARRTGDYTFFKTLQAHALIDETDHVAILHAILANDADSVLSSLDNLNAGIAYVHQDAFKVVYDNAKSTMYKADNSPSSRRSLLQVDISQQRDMADHAIDKTTNSAIHLIEAQPAHCQDAIANAWITGTTIIADAVCVCLNQMEEVESNIDDFIRLEYSWGTIQNSVDAAVSALRGIFNLMAGSNGPALSRSFSISSGGGSENGSGSFRSRASSTASAFGLIKKAFGHNAMPPPPTPKSGRTGSLPVLPYEPSSRGFRLNMSSAFPTRMPEHSHTQLSTIPPTPSVHTTPKKGIQDTLSPFKEKDDYFAFNMDKEVSPARKQTSASQDLMQLDSLDPLYTPTMDECIKMPIPLTLRRVSASFGGSAPSTVAV